MRLNALAAPAFFNENRAEWVFESRDFKRFDSDAAELEPGVGNE